MSLDLSLAAQFALLVLVTPLLWSGIVAGLRYTMSNERPLSDRQEKAVLGLMSLPALVGLVAVLMPDLLPP
ncbi:MAG: hypothetical protein AAGA69_09410, partial [Pseudomonadota bacterium]